MAGTFGWNAEEKENLHLVAAEARPSVEDGMLSFLIVQPMKLLLKH